MKILLITPFVPTNVGAGVNYTRQFICDLSMNHKVDIVLFRTKEDLAYKIPNSNVIVLREFRVSLIKKLFNALMLFFMFPLFTAKFNLLILFYLRRLIEKGNYDVVYFDFSQMFLYAKFLRHKNKILMAHDVITQRYSRVGNKLMTKYCSLTENLVLHTSNAQIFTFSDKDTTLLSSLFGVQSTPTSFYLSKDVIQAFPVKLGEYFVFFAMWKRDDNYEGLDWFLYNVLPHCLEKSFKIIGGGLSQKMQDKIRAYHNIEYLGFVDNPYPIIANAKALISPLFSGAGVKVKVIDALACGTPIIGTDIAFEGISSKYSDFMLQAKDTASFICRINRIDISLEARSQFKCNFLATYSDKNVMRYINSLE